MLTKQRHPIKFPQYIHDTFSVCKTSWAHSLFILLSSFKCLYLSTLVTNTSIFVRPLQERSRTAARGRTATGALPGQMSWPDTTGNTLEPNPSSASPAAAASRAPTIWPCTWSATRIREHRPARQHTFLINSIERRWQGRTTTPPFLSISYTHIHTSNIILQQQARTQPRLRVRFSARSHQRR